MQSLRINGFVAALSAAVLVSAGGAQLAARAHAPAQAGRTAAGPLEEAQSLGAPLFADGDTLHGGRGKPVAGIRCEAMETTTFHVHAHLSLFVDGKQIAVPRNVGVVPVSDDPDPDLCYYWLHTHDASGLIHVESPHRTAFVLGDFFRVWGEPLDAYRVGDFHGPVRAFVDGRRYDGDPARIPIAAHARITLEIGALVQPPAYTFPTRT